MVFLGADVQSVPRSLALGSTDSYIIPEKLQNEFSSVVESYAVNLHKDYYGWMHYLPLPWLKLPTISRSL